MSYDDFVTETRRTFDRASTSPHSWLSNMSDAVACAWDSARCHPGSMWLGIKESFMRRGEEPGEHVEQVRQEAHGKVDELYKAVKSEL